MNEALIANRGKGPTRRKLQDKNTVREKLAAGEPLAAVFALQSIL